MTNYVFREMEETGPEPFFHAGFVAEELGGVPYAAATDIITDALVFSQEALDTNDWRSNLPGWEPVPVGLWRNRCDLCSEDLDFDMQGERPWTAFWTPGRRNIIRVHRGDCETVWPYRDVLQQL